MKIKIIYETQVGTTQFVAEVMQSALSPAGHEVELHSVRARGRHPKLEGFDAVIFGSPTYSMGNLEPSMERLINDFQPDLSKLKVAVFSLGDSNYQHFCGSAGILENWVMEHKGELAIPTLKIDGYPRDLEPIKEWVTSLVQ